MGIMRTLSTKRAGVDSCKVQIKSEGIYYIIILDIRTSSWNTSSWVNAVVSNNNSWLIKFKKGLKG